MNCTLGLPLKASMWYKMQHGSWIKSHVKLYMNCSDRQAECVCEKRSGRNMNLQIFISLFHYCGCNFYSAWFGCISICCTSVTLYQCFHCISCIFWRVICLLLSLLPLKRIRWLIIWNKTVATTKSFALATHPCTMSSLQWRIPAVIVLSSSNW